MYNSMVGNTTGKNNVDTVIQILKETSIPPKTSGIVAQPAPSNPKEDLITETLSCILENQYSIMCYLQHDAYRDKKYAGMFGIRLRETEDMKNKFNKLRKD